MSQGNHHHHHPLNPMHALQTLLSGGTLSNDDMEEMAQNVIANAQNLGGGLGVSVFPPGVVVPPGMNPPPGMLLPPIASYPPAPPEGPPPSLSSSAISPPSSANSKKTERKEPPKGGAVSVHHAPAFGSGGFQFGKEGAAPATQAIATKKRPLPETQGASSPAKKKAAASKDEPVIAKAQIDETAWNAVLERIPRCSAAEGVRETSVFKTKHSPGGAAQSGCLRKLLQELSSLEDSLPTNPAIWLRFDEETPQFLRALITAPTGTPYALGLFCFDIFVPDTYPHTPPKMQLLTTGGGTVNFSPNLYSNGKVCLSLLNTWHGPGWNSRHSTLLQVLVSIQGLILGVEHPYYLEPGHGGWEGDIKQGGVKTVPLHVKQYEDRIRKGTMQFAMLDMFAPTPSSTRRPPYLEPFGDAIVWHFFHCKDVIRQETAAWVVDNTNNDPSSTYWRSSNRALHRVVDQLEEALVKLKAPEDTADGKRDVDIDKSEKGGADNKKKAATSGDKLESLVAAKRVTMKEAAAKEDFIAAGRLQSEIEHLETAGVELKIVTKRSEMEEAAKKGDYIAAGKLQSVVQHLEKSKKRLQELERCMFEAASKQDFVRAGRLQEQYQILQECSCSEDNSSKSQQALGPQAASMGEWQPPSFPPFFSGSGFPTALFGVGPPPSGPPAAYPEYETEYPPEDIDEYGEY